MSRPITAQQLVHTNLMPEYSPTGTRGWQVACASPGLSPEDAEAIKTHVARSLPEGMTESRWQYFCLKDGRPVVARTARFITDGKISDPRGSPQIAHALVLSVEDFEEIECHPLSVLLGFGSLFLRSSQAMVERFGLRAGVIPPVQVECADLAEPEQAATWREWFCLACLAAEGTPEAGASPSSLLLHGEPAGIKSWIQLTLDSVPPSLRRHCTFDTMVSLRTIRPGDFWAVGTATRDASPSYRTVDAGRRILQPVTPCRTFGASLYGRWLEQKSAEDDGTPVPIFPVLRQVQTAAACLSSRTPLPESCEIDPDIWEPLKALAADSVLRDFGARVTGLTTPEIADCFADWALGPAEGAKQVELALRLLGDPQELCGAFFEWLHGRRPRLDLAVFQKLHQFARESGHPDLVLLTQLWLPAKKRPSLEAALKHASAEGYRRILELCPDEFPLEDLIAPQFGSALLERLSTLELSDKEIVQWVGELAGQGYEGPFDPLLERLAELPEKSLQRLPPAVFCSTPELEKRRLLRQASHQPSLRPLWKRVLGRD